MTREYPPNTYYKYRWKQRYSFLLLKKVTNEYMKTHSIVVAIKQVNMY